MGYPPATATPPGWYPDPWYPQSTRYWDGSTWTAHAQRGLASVGRSHVRAQVADVAGVAFRSRPVPAR